MIAAGIAALVLIVAACASAPVPELAGARAAYARAAAGPAARLTPGLLRTAKESLDRAESAQGRDEEEARHRAYVAIRKAETADAAAQALLAAERRNEIDREIATLERQRLEAAAPPVVASETPGDPNAVERTVTVEKEVPHGEAGEAIPPGASSPASTPARASAAAPSKATAEPSRQASAAAPPSAVIERLARLGNVRSDARGVAVTLAGPSVFMPGDSGLSPAGLSSLETVASAVKVSSSREPVVIEVHSGGAGTSREAELMLSQQRAEAVRSFLIARGVDPDRVVARGVGRDRPLLGSASPAPATPHQQDRLEIILPSGGR